MTNPKLIFKGDKLFLIDAFSKAPTWEIKNGEEIKGLLLWQESGEVPMQKDWQPEGSKIKIYFNPKII